MDVLLVSDTSVLIALSALAAHPRCRLPRAEVHKRLDAYRGGK